MTRVFVYGSLLKGFGNHNLLEDSLFVGDALTEGHFSLLHLGGFPGLVEKGNTSVHGEIYDVDDATLRQLDRLEGHPSFYCRTPIRVLPVGTNQIAEWETVDAYLLTPDWLDAGPSIIESGNWKARGR